MLKFLTPVLFLLLSTIAQAQSPWYFGSGEAVNLTNGTKFKNGVKNISGSLDPSSVAVNAPAGSMYFSTNGTIYVKQDSGSTTNWTALGSSSAISTINSQSGPAIILAAGTTGTDFAISASANTVTFNIPSASGSARGLLTSANWTTFNGKQDALVNSAGLASAISDETGTGVAVFNTAPSFAGTSAFLNSTADALVATMYGTTTATNNSSNIVNFKRITSGDMTDNFGARLNFQIEDNAAVGNTLGYLGFRRKGADNSGQFFLTTRSAGSDLGVFTIDPDGDVGIGTEASASAALDVSSTTRGVLFPRLTSTQRDALVSPATGLTIFNTTTAREENYNGSSWNYSLSSTALPIVQPTLVLNFAETKRLPSDITFTRASTRTCINAFGVIVTLAINEPCFDHDSATGESKGISIEESRTNLLLNSATLSTQTTTVTAADHTLSFYGTGTVTLTGTSTAGPLVGTASNSRVSLTFTPTAGSLTLTVSGSVTFANLELGSTATSYIPTIGSTVTRSADVAQMTGTNFSSWYNQTEGTFVARFNVPTLQPSTLAQFIFMASNNTTGFEISAFKRANADQTARFSVGNTAGSDQVFLSNGTFLTGTQIWATAYKANDFAYSINGGSAVTDGAGTVPSNLSQLDIGRYVSANGYLNGTIAHLYYYPKRLTNVELQAVSR